MSSVVLIDDHQIVLAGLQRVLAFESRIRVIGTGATIAEAKALTARLKPDVLVLDLRLPDSRGPAEIAEIKALCPTTRVLVLTGYGEAARSECERYGADAFLTKELGSERIIAQILELSGQYALSSSGSLTARESEIAAMVASGLSNPEIAESLSLSVNTVKTHVAHVLTKLNLRSRVELARMWADRR